MRLSAMQETASDVITLSSDDEFEPKPPKRFKSASGIIKSLTETQDALKLLGRLKEISTIEENAEEKSRNKYPEENGLTIIIESSENVKEGHKSFTSNSSVVIIDEDPLEENLAKSDENLNKDPMIVVDDPSEESEDCLEPTTQVTPSSNENGHLEEQQPREIEIDERPSTSKASEAHKLLDQFLETCANSIKGSKYETKLLLKFPKMRKHFNNCENLHNEISLKRMLQDHIKMAQISAPDAVVGFQRIFSYFLDNIRGASIVITEENLHKIRKLETTCRKIMKKLKQLDESEVDFDDESDSAYLQTERYSKRLSEVYSKYCQLINRNPHAGRLLYEKVCFASSDYHEINRAITKITKTYKQNKFPSYYDIEKCVRKCVSKHNLSLTEHEIKEESKSCFTKLGNLLQLRRKKELYEDHCGFITLNEDPANKNQELKAKLENSLNEGAKKMSEVISKYVKYQEENVNPELSEDSEDSNYQSSVSDA